ncbi:hypothetical protein H8K90_01985 [Winogradskyella echinorum]|uniref:Uncharacterized protein n=1 Tax=Winogradskyella echinorum TaxID=538189 RepID=A0ABR6XXA5_9FLAO|nr:hypothetical protein [Winogradskyella echinorum]MBC3845137.1 hypothetical protein [Winogradskyella echinorum]MBC5749485.1 hypothetical protein [Winogradskyella echinorum]
MPLGESMRSTLKSNKSIMLDKSKRFRKTLGGYDKNRKIEFNLPKATPEQLKEIRQKLKKENQNLWIKILSITAILIVGLVWMLKAS